VEREVRRALREAEVSVERKITGRRGIGWIAYAGSGEMAQKEKDECRVRWREFIQSGKVIEVAPKQRRARRVVNGNFNDLESVRNFIEISILKFPEFHELAKC
jgi:hypothetical protein